MGWEGGSRVNRYTILHKEWQQIPNLGIQCTAPQTWQNHLMISTCSDSGLKGLWHSLAVRTW